jgi:hypothetical protein
MWPYTVHYAKGFFLKNSVWFLLMQILIVTSVASAQYQDPDDNSSNEGPTPLQYAASPKDYAVSLKPQAIQWMQAALGQGHLEFIPLIGALEIAPLFNDWQGRCAGRDVVAYTNLFFEINFCPSFLDVSETFAIETIIHEANHYVGNLSECKSDALAKIATEAAGVTYEPSGYADSCARGIEPGILGSIDVFRDHGPSDNSN